MASTTTTPTAAAASAAGDDDEVIRDFGPMLRVYKSGRLERPLVAPPVAPGHDAATGVDSKDVHLGDYSVRLYLPPSARAVTNRLPVVVYIHGGGFVAESAASPNYHRFLNRLAAAVPAVCVSVDYRLAPEHPLPAAYDDCLAALRWVFSPDAADTWIAAHGDLARVFVAGDSAGGNICHHLAMHHHDAPRLKGAVFIHPWFWGSEAVGEETRDAEGRARGAGLWMFACPDTSGMDDPRMNPMAPGAPGLERLACDRVMVCAAEGDFLRWRAHAYAAAVAAARGGGVEVLETEGEGHVFYLFDPDGDKAKEMMDRMVAFVNADAAA
uniref:Alpha/beta hydrolase fold-3 domain-containing protein n=1 Tax=Leersia perrieri TaxID=77586 RepID=A0A0D9VHB4_9ORYZ